MTNFCQIINKRSIKCFQSNLSLKISIIYAIMYDKYHMGLYKIEIIDF